MLDVLDMEATLTAEERAVRDTARDYVQTEVTPLLADCFVDAAFPEQVIPAFGELGFFGPDLDLGEEPPVSARAYGLLMQELEAGDSSLRVMASVQGSLVMYPLATYGSAAVRERYLDALAVGDSVGCFALTEPEHGSDPRGLETTAVRRGDTYVLSGTKRWITNAPMADVAIVWARDRSAEGDPLRGFVVPLDADGVRVTTIPRKLATRIDQTGEIVLDGVAVPADHVLDVDGMRGPLSCLSKSRYTIAWGVVGAAKDAYQAAVEYALEREQWGGPIAGFQLQQRKLAEMATQISLAELLAHRLATLFERGEETPGQVAMAKRHNVRMARDVCRTARELLGGNGVTLDYSPVRHLVNMESVHTYEGTHDIQTLILGAELTGLPAFEA